MNLSDFHIDLSLIFQKKGKKKKDESEEGEISSNDEREEEFDDGLDEDPQRHQSMFDKRVGIVCQHRQSHKVSFFRLHSDFHWSHRWQEDLCSS